MKPQTKTKEILLFTVTSFINKGKNLTGTFTDLFPLDECIPTNEHNNLSPWYDSFLPLACD